MGGRTQFKHRHISELGLPWNAKEEILLNKKLTILESMKRQAEDAHTLDQRILYNRFTTKLRRSEVAHAKLLGHQDLVEQLCQSPSPRLHSVVSDGSKKAVSIMVQKAEALRAASTPCRIRTHLAPVSPFTTLNPTDSQGKGADVQQNSLGTRGKYNARGDQKGNTSNERQAVSSYKRPHTTNQKSDRLCDMKIRWQKGFTKFPPQLKLPAPMEPGMPLFPKEPVEKVLGKEPKFRNFSGRNQTLSSLSRNLFLGLDDTPLDVSSSMDNRRTVDNHGVLSHQVKLFIQKTTALKQEPSSLSQDYYSERLLEKLGRKWQGNLDFLYDSEEQRKWNLVGPEPNHRSITIQKLDSNVVRQFLGGTDMGIVQ